VDPRDSGGAAAATRTFEQANYRTTGTLFGELEKRDYRRVGLVNLREHDKRVDNNWLAAYLVEQTRLQPGTPFTPTGVGTVEYKDISCLGRALPTAFRSKTKSTFVIWMEKWATRTRQIYRRRLSRRDKRTAVDRPS
jgi:hypothetical protein